MPQFAHKRFVGSVVNMQVFFEFRFRDTLIWMELMRSGK